MMRPILKKSYPVAGAIAWNVGLLYLIFLVCRLLFVGINWDLYKGSLSWPLAISMLRGGLLFDTAAICYMNVLYVVLMLIPLPCKERKGYYGAIKIVFVVINSLGIVANLIDAVYFQFSGRRTTASVFKEFGHENNLWQILGTALVTYWYLTLAGVLLIYVLWALYRNPSLPCTKPRLRYVGVNLGLLAVLGVLSVFGMRGSWGHDRPITLSNANSYVTRPVEAAAVLNTPFTLLRTMGNRIFVNPHYYQEDQLATIYSPLHNGSDTAVFKKKNVVVIIVESLGREYIGALNPTLEGGRYKGYTPFLDSLITCSLTFEYSLANGRKSIDAMPSVLAGIPMFVEPFFLTQFSLNRVHTLAWYLKEMGYYSAFFHGAPNGYMGFEAFARAGGFDDYFGMTQYDCEPGFHGKRDFDGHWAIWDEEFLQFFCKKMGGFKQPFITSVFTATSHDPFRIPKRYEGKFRAGDRPIHRCIGYTDYSLRRLFASASREPWYKNTLFVITGDHTNMKSHPEYATDYGLFEVPVIFFDPSGEMPRGLSPAIAQQTDITPTILGYLGYNKPYIAFGIDLLHTPPQESWAVNYCNGIYQYAQGEYLLQFDGKRSMAIYNIKSDKLLKNNLMGHTNRQPLMERELKGIIQQYMQRMTQDRLTTQKER